MSWILFAVASPYAAEVAEIVRRGGSRVSGAVVNRGRDRVPRELADGVTPEGIPPMWFHLPVAVPLTTPGHRKAAATEARALGFRRFPPLVDPTAVVAASARLGEGCVLNAASLVAAGTRLGAFVSLNRGAMTGHHCRIEDWASLGPGARLCGHVVLGEGAYVGAGAVVLPEITVGRNAVVGAGSVVTRPVGDGELVVGNPAVVKRRGLVGFNGVGV